jgi:hypothetical protein
MFNIYIVRSNDTEFKAKAFTTETEAQAYVEALTAEAKTIADPTTDYDYYEQEIELPS